MHILGIAFGGGLSSANLPIIFSCLGAHVEDQIPLLCLFTG